MTRDDMRAVVVGAGLEGLLLGGELARAGWSVDVLERRLVVGGRFTAVGHRGFVLERGIHLAAYGSRGALGELLFRQDEPVQLRELGESHALDGERVEQLPLSLVGMVRRSSLGLRDRLRGLRLAVQLRSSAEPGGQVEGDLDTWLRSQGVSPGLSDAVRRMASASMMCAPAGQLAAREVLETLRRGLDRGVVVAYPGEGWGRVVSRARSRLESFGGRVHLGREARFVSGSSTQVEGVTDAQGRHHGANVVIWTAGARALADAAVFPVPALDASLGGLVSVPGIAATWGLSEPVTATTGLWICDEPRAWIHCPSNVAPSVAPQGHQCVQAMLPTDLPRDDRRARRRAVDVLEERLENVFPGFASKVLFRRTVYLPRAHAIDGRVGAGRDERPPVDLKNPAGLYLVGRETAMPGLGADLPFESVRRCVSDLLGADAVLPTQIAPESSEAGSAMVRTTRKDGQ